MAQTCCQLVWHSSTEEQGRQFTLNSAAVHWCLVTANLFAEWIFTGKNAEAQGCCQLVWHSSTEEQGRLHCSVLVCIISSLQLLVWGFAPHTGEQVCNTNALQHRPEQNTFPTAQCLPATQAHSMLRVSAIAPMGGMLFTQVCSAATTMHCSTGQNEIHSPLLSACLQTRLTACSVSLQLHLWEQCSSYRCAVAQQQCSATLLLAKCNWPLLSVAVQNKLTAGLFCCNNAYGDLLLIQVCSGPTVQCHTAFGKMQLPPAQCCCAEQDDRRLILLQIHLWRFAVGTGVQWPKTSAVPHCFWQNAIGPCSVLLCRTG